MFRPTKKKKIQNSKRSFRSSLPEKADDDDKDDKLEAAPGTNEDDQDEDPTVIIRRKSNDKKRSKRSGTVIKSFNAYDDEDDNGDIGLETKSKDKQSRKSGKKRKRKGGGLGFGGGFVGSTDADGDGAEDDNNREGLSTLSDEKKHGEAHSTSGSYYGKEALEALKAEQKKRPTSETSADGETAVNPESNAVTETMPVDASTMKMLGSKLPTEKTSSPLPSYIPLNANGMEKQPTILTGEEAMQYQDEDKVESACNACDKMDVDNDFAIDGEHFQSVPNESTDDWEEQVVRRAGLTRHQPQAGAMSPSGPGYRKVSSAKPISSYGDIPSLSTLKKQLQSTVSNLRLQTEDLENATMRRQADLVQTQADLKRHKQSLEDSGSSCEYYQQLRLVVTSHVGAMRDLQQKLKPIHDAMLELILSQWRIRELRIREWQDDVGSILNDCGLLDRVIGRQSQFPNQSTERIVDEFGRDVQSQYSKLREKRYHQRMERIRRSFKKNVEGDNNDEHQLTNMHEFFTNSFWTDEQELRDWKQRHSALKEALTVALDDIDNEYTSMVKLLDVFRDWRKTRSEEYHQCYANLSLGDLAGILVLADFFRSSWLGSIATISGEDTNAENQDDVGLIFSWVEQIESFQGEDSRANLGEAEVVSRTVEKSILAFIIKLAAHSQFLELPSPVSLLLSQCVSQVVRILQRSVDANGAVLEQLKSALSNALGKTLDGISMMIVKGDISDGHSSSTNQHEQMQYAVETARGSGVDYVRNVMVTILEHWVPVMQILSTAPSSISNESDEAYIGVILDFVSTKYLLVLSSIPNRQKASMLFTPVWKLLKNRYENWLNSPSFFMQAAPIRAAAIAYGSLNS